MAQSMRVASVSIVSALLVAWSVATPALAVQFDYLDPGYTQEIYTGPLVGGPGMAWTNAGNLMNRNGSDILVYSLTQNAVHQGTNVHASIATYTIPGLSSTGYGLAKGLDGYIYTPTNVGLQRFNPNNWAAPAQTLAGTVGGQGYGITTLPDGRLAYVAGWSTNNVYLYDPVNLTNTLIYTASGLIDDIEASSTGAIALAGQANSDITIISNTGAVINNFATPHYPDGLAFGDGAASTSLFSNNNDGSITRYVLGAGYLGVPVITDIALQTKNGKAYGDLAAVGPDCAFYVSQFENGGYHGSTPGVGTHWDNGVTNAEASIIRIAAVGPDGTEICGFGTATGDVPEPGTLLLIIAGVVPFLSLSRRLRRG
ncbi:MAG TPA: hypothetical protein DD670_16865 [Planctomycetaceae bacterium]|nr:hypothetical protein [Planctomycetaceae bacterium]